MNPLKPVAYAYYHDGQMDDEHHPIVQNRPKSRGSFREEPWKEVPLYPLLSSGEPLAWMRHMGGQRWDLTIDPMIRDEWLAERCVLTPLYSGLQLLTFVEKAKIKAERENLAHSVLTRDPTEAA